MKESTLITLLVIGVGVLICIVMWKMLDNSLEKSTIKKWVGCVGLRACNKGKDCGEGEVCYSGVCLSRKICKAPGEIATVECSTGEKCMSVGDIGYCVPLKVSEDPPPSDQTDTDKIKSDLSQKLGTGSKN